ncbi:Growth-regulating factor 1 [Linum grandiflorum]
MQQPAANRSSSPDAFPNRFTLTDANANTNARFHVPRASSSAVNPPKQNVESPYSDFGHVSFDSSLNPSQQKNTRGCYNSFLNFNGQDHTQDQHSLHQFMDNDWPKDGQSSRNVISWPEELKSDWTQLSMSIPMTSSDFSSSSPSPPHKKLALSPLRLSRETEKQPASWMPTPWGGPSMGGGPLGEALSGNVKNSRFVKTSNMATHEELGFSPTGVLQKATFGSLSNNSSSGSSPRGGDESKHELLPYL